MKQFRNPDTVHQPLAAYTHHIEISGPQRWVVLSGQVGVSPDGSLPADPVKQLEIALENIYRNLQSADMEISDIVKLTIYLVDPIDADKRRTIFSKWLQGHEPCMTLLYVAALATPTIKVEVEATACTGI